MRGFFKTPLLRSTPLSARTGKNIFLKMDCMQPSGSFKDRGMTNFCQSLKSRGFNQVYSSSGGNAGLAVATVGRNLNMGVTVVVPKTTNEIMKNKISAENAKVIVHGDNWNEADELTQRLVAENPEKNAYAHPFDNPLIWDGHSTLVDELAEELPKPPDAIFCSVGGGGLLMGILLGLKKNGWNSTTIVPCETFGADCFYQAFEQKKIVTLPEITSIATSLGAKAVLPEALTEANNWNCLPSRVTDADCLNSIRDFLAHHRILVEPACAASIAALENKNISIENFENIVVVVCGGSGTNLEILKQYEQKVFGAEK